MARGVDFQGEGNAAVVNPAVVGLNVPAGNLSVMEGQIILGAVQQLTGVAATRAAVRADGGDAAGIGSVYFSTNGGATTAPKVYFKIANATADADWEKVVTTAAD